jgi:hypothetical protein
LQGKVALIDFATNTREWAHVYQPGGINPPGETFPASMRPARGAVNDLAQFQKAGAVAVILGWTDIPTRTPRTSTPFSRPPQGIPGSRRTRHARDVARALRQGANATVVLEADTFPDTPTEHADRDAARSTDEVVIVNTHTDGPTRPRKRRARHRRSRNTLQDSEERSEAHARLPR